MLFGFAIQMNANLNALPLDARRSWPTIASTGRSVYFSACRNKDCHPAAQRSRTMKLALFNNMGRAVRE